MEKVIIAGLTLPFYPMRPRNGGQITAANAVDIYQKISDGSYHAQRKLNGDRAVLGVDANGRAWLANRHGSWFKHPALNIAKHQLPAETLLDGEVFERKFYPFEAIAVGGGSLRLAGPEKRAAVAQVLCPLLGVDWIFDSRDVTLEWLLSLGREGSKWEGVVLKAIGSPYVPLGSSNQESPAWVKKRWL
jgi:hypothetical protein